LVGYIASYVYSVECGELCASVALHFKQLYSPIILLKQMNFTCVGYLVDFIRTLI